MKLLATVWLVMDSSFLYTTRKTRRPVAPLFMKMKPKYVTRKKRIRELEKQVAQLQQQVETLTNLLDSVTQMVYAKRPRLARNEAREFKRIHPSVKEKTTPRLKERNLPLAPRADLVTTRDTNGQLIATPKAHQQV